MKWITASNLEMWAKKTGAREALITLIGELIRVTAPSIKKFRFPDGDKAQVRGFDGELISETEEFCVPMGQSVWEFGVSRGVSKANSDYTSCTEKTDESVRKRSTLVMVNPNTWDTSVAANSIDNWIRTKTAASEWASVRYIDGTQIETWLDMCPAIAARFSRNVINLAPPQGCQSLDEFWEKYSNQFRIPLSASVLLADRQSEAEFVIESLRDGTGAWTIGADSEEEGIAFAIAAIKKAQADLSAQLMARTLIVSTEEAARAIFSKKNLSIILKGDACGSAGYLSERFSTLTIAVGIRARKHKTLPRPSASAMSNALCEMGLAPDAAYDLALSSGRSIAILRRLFSKGVPPEPEWVNNRSDLVAAILAGGWSTKTAIEKDILARLADASSYPEFERRVRILLDYPDRPIDNVVDVWQIRSIVDAFPYIASLLGDADLERLKDAFIEVYNRPVLIDSISDFFKKDFQPSENFSEWIRSGLALTMLTIATLGEINGMSFSNRSPQHYVDSVVSSLPGWGQSARGFHSLGGEITIIAEASPTAFLSAIECLIHDHRDEALSLFSESTDFLSASSPHVSLLFALEVLAWDPSYLRRVCLVLARLAEIDPGGKLSNRPINSLRSILLAWSPNTYASQEERIQTIKQIIQKKSTIGWQLILSLLPSSFDHNDVNPKPRLRNFQREESVSITHAQLWAMNSFVSRQAVSMAAGNEDRLVVLLKHSSSFSSGDLQPLLDALDEFLSNRPLTAQNPVWFELRRQVNRHKAHADTEWAMSELDLVKCQKLMDKHASGTPVSKVRWLFDDWIIDSDMDDKDENGTLVSHQSAHNLRAAALIDIIETYGQEELKELMLTAQQPSLICDATEFTDLSLNQFNAIFEAALDVEEFCQRHIATLSAIGYFKFGKEWWELVAERVRSGAIDNELATKLVVLWPPSSQTWRLISELGAAVENTYWESVWNLPQQGPIAELRKAIAVLRQHRRSYVVISSASRRLTELSGQELLQLLDEVYAEIGRGAIKVNTMTGHYVNIVFDVLAHKAEISQADIARREFFFLSLLQDYRKSFSIHALMAKDSSFFIEVVSAVYRADDAEEITSEQEKVVAHYAFKVLNSFHSVPGATDSDVNFEELSRWVIDVRCKAIEVKRSVVVDTHIGQVLAHAPLDRRDDCWPHHSIRRLLEQISNEKIENSIVTERINMRGAHSRKWEDGGAPEREIAKRYRDWAGVAEGYPRTNNLLVELAEHWEDSGKSHDERTAKLKLKR